MILMHLRISTTCLQRPLSLGPSSGHYRQVLLYIWVDLSLFIHFWVCVIRTCLCVCTHVHTYICMCLVKGCTYRSCICTYVSTDVCIFLSVFEYGTSYHTHTVSNPLIYSLQWTGLFTAQQVVCWDRSVVLLEDAAQGTPRSLLDTSYQPDVCMYVYLRMYIHTQGFI